MGRLTGRWQPLATCGREAARRKLGISLALGVFLVFRIIVLLILVSAPGIVLASVEVPLSWETVELRIEQRGGVEVAASRNGEGLLEALSVTIRGVPIDIPDSCLPGKHLAYLNNLSIAYGEFEGGVPYWSLKMDVDHAESFEGVATYHLVLLEQRVKLAYIERAESETTLVDEPPLCGSWH